MKPHETICPEGCIAMPMKNSFGIMPMALVTRHALRVTHTERLETISRQYIPVDTGGEL